MAAPEVEVPEVTPEFAAPEVTPEAQAEAEDNVEVRGAAFSL